MGRQLKIYYTNDAVIYQKRDASRSASERWDRRSQKYLMNYDGCPWSHRAINRQPTDRPFVRSFDRCVYTLNPIRISRVFIMQKKQTMRLAAAERCGQSMIREKESERELSGSSSYQQL